MPSVTRTDTSTLHETAIAPGDIPTSPDALAETFSKSVHHVLSTMLQIQASVEPIGPDCEPVSRRIRCAAALSGAATGSVSCTFSAASAESLVALFTGTRAAAGTPGFADAITELTGMICKTFATLLADGAIEVGTTELTIGASDQPAHHDNAVALQCRTDIADFAVEIAVIPAADTAS